MYFNPLIHHRRSIRLKNYDYACEGIYFLTLCVEGREHLFGEITNGRMKLNAFGRIVEQEWYNTIEIRDNISLGEFIIMPNHIHGIIYINLNKNNEQTSSSGKFKSPSHTIGAIIRGFKGATTKKIKSSFFEAKLGAGESIVRANCHSPQPNSGEPIVRANCNSPQLTEEELKILSLFDFSKSIWQRNYYEHIIKNQQSFENISDYIKNNPKNWDSRKQ